MAAPVPGAVAVPGVGGGRDRGPAGWCRPRRRTAGRGEDPGGPWPAAALSRLGRWAVGAGTPPARRGRPARGGAGLCGAVRGGPGRGLGTLARARSAAARAEGRGEES